MLDPLSLPDAIDQLADSLDAHGMHRSADLWRDMGDDFRASGVRTLGAPVSGGVRPPFLWGIATGVFGSVAVTSGVEMIGRLL